MPLDVRRMLVDRELSTKPADKGGLSIIKQCAVLEIHRSGLYYTPRPVIEEDLQLMRLMDLLHLEDTTKGTWMLSKDLADHGFTVGRARMRRLMRLMRIKAVYCMPRSTVIDAAKYKHPYLQHVQADGRRLLLPRGALGALPGRGVSAPVAGGWLGPANGRSGAYREPLHGLR
jgi:hypothetical protein